MICIDKNYSTTRLLTREKPVLENKPEDKFESVLFLPEGEERKGEGGLRMQGYFKTSLKDKPLITVITVVFNGEQFLEETIQSVINQTYDNVEYIIIDGGSTDGTLDIIRKYEYAIDYWVSEYDNGIYDAFNKGIRCCQGQYYIVLGCDDVLFEKSIKKLVDSSIKENCYDYIVASMFLGDKLRSGVNPSKGWLGAHAMVTGHSVGMIISLNVHRVLGLYSTKYRLASDALFIKKLFYSDLRRGLSNVIMGRFSLGGVSNNDTAHALTEGFLVQLETEKNKILQVIIFIIRLIKNIQRV